MSVAKRLLDELMEVMQYRGLSPEEGKALEIIERYVVRGEGFSAADIREFLANNLPCYEKGDDFFFLANVEDIETVAQELYYWLVTTRVCINCGLALTDGYCYPCFSGKMDNYQLTER